MILKIFLQKFKILFFIIIFSISVVTLSAQQSAIATNAMVVAPTPEAIEAGLSILKQGGNAIDAAAATAFALMVTDPAMCSVGGRSQILIYLKDGQLIGIDGATQSPRIVEEPALIGHGYQTCPIPGSPAALEEVVIKYGTLLLRMILEPAIQLAKEGFVIKKDYHESFRRYVTLFHLYPGTAKHFLKPDGTFYSEGERLVQPALARTLEIIADEGAGSLYRGKLAEVIIKDMQNNQGLVTAEDLAQYRPRQGEIVRGNYRGFKIISRGDQCDGASVIEVLQILEHFNLSDYQLDNPKYLHLIAQAMAIGNLDEYLPDWQQTSEALAARRVREIDLNRALPVPIKPKAPEEEGYTNHLSVIDEKGNAVSLTQSIGPIFGSKVVNPELGFFYAYSYDMNNDPIPYQREKTCQSPTIVLKNDKPFIVLGSAGSSRIPASIVQAIINVIDHKMTLYRAVASPRIFLYENELRIEAMNMPASILDELQMMGYKIKPYDQLNGWFGRIHGILIEDATRKIYGVADPRDCGAAKGY